jgi:hypothetical protein
VFNLDKLNFNNDPRLEEMVFSDFIQGITIDSNVIFTTKEPFGEFVFEAFKYWCW